MTKDRKQLQHLFQFDLWCTRQLTNLYFKNEPFAQQEAILAFISHIINAQKIWFQRMMQLPFFEDIDVWFEYDPEEIKMEAKETSQLWLDLLEDSNVDLDKKITYQNSSQITYRNSLREVCHHLIIHGQHHRAQIAIFLNNCDIKPPSIDYIHFARSKNIAKNLS